MRIVVTQSCSFGPYLAGCSCGAWRLSIQPRRETVVVARLFRVYLMTRVSYLRTQPCISTTS